jgi:hypothetical protein
MNLVGKRRTYVLLSVTFSENRIVYEIIWTNILQPERLQMTLYYNSANALCVLGN